MGSEKWHTGQKLTVLWFLIHVETPGEAISPAVFHHSYPQALPGIKLVCAVGPACTSQGHNVLPCLPGASARPEQGWEAPTQSLTGLVIQQTLSEYRSHRYTKTTCSGNPDTFSFSRGHLHL